MPYHLITTNTFKFMKAPVKDLLKLRTIKLPDLTQYRNNFEVLVNLAFIVAFITGLGILYVD